MIWCLLRTKRSSFRTSYRIWYNCQLAKLCQEAATYLISIHWLQRRSLQEPAQVGWDQPHKDWSTKADPSKAAKAWMLRGQNNQRTSVESWINLSSTGLAAILRSECLIRVRFLRAIEAQTQTGIWGMMQFVIFSLLSKFGHLANHGSRKFGQVTVHVLDFLCVNLTCYLKKKNNNSHDSTCVLTQTLTCFISIIACSLVLFFNWTILMDALTGKSYRLTIFFSAPALVLELSRYSSLWKVSSSWLGPGFGKNQKASPKENHLLLSYMCRQKYECPRRCCWKHYCSPPWKANTVLSFKIKNTTSSGWSLVRDSGYAHSHEYRPGYPPWSAQQENLPP